MDVDEFGSLLFGSGAKRLSVSHRSPPLSEKRIEYSQSFERLASEALTSSEIRVANGS